MIFAISFILFVLAIGLFAASAKIITSTLLINVKKMHPDAVIPTYATTGAACFDLHACGLPDGGLMLTPGQPRIIDTGLAFDIPRGYVMNVYSRSGQAFHTDVRLANCVGKIDSDYTGSVLIKLTRDTSITSYDRKTIVRNGDRIAQAEIVPCEQVEFMEVDEITETARGAQGFGSTGR